MRNISGDKLTHEVIKTSKTFYRSQDLEVRIGGNMAATNGKMVMLPSIPTDVDYTPDEVAVVRGFVDHEAGHGRHTNFNLAKRKPWKDMLKKYAHFMPISNGLEDVRIERLITDEYPGSKRNLEATSAWANNMYLEAHAQDPDIAQDIARVGAIGITWEGRRRMGYDDPTIEKCLDTLPADIRKQVCDAVDMLDKAKSTTDCFKASEKLLKSWGLDYDREEAEEQQRQEQERQRQEQQRQQEEGDGDGHDSDSQASQRSQADDTQEDEDDGGAQARGSREGETDGEGDVPMPGTGLTSGPQPADPLDPNLDRAMHDVVRGKGSTGGSYTAVNSHYDTHYKPGDRGNHAEWLEGCRSAVESDSTYKSVMQGMGSRLNKIRRNIERALVSTQERTWRGGYEEGQLDGRALVRGMTGSANIYRRRQDTPELDTSVMLVLDGSASMNGEPARLAFQSAIALSEVFEKVDIPFSVAMFNTYAHETNEYKHGYKKGLRNADMGQRGHAISTWLLKDYDETLRRSRDRIELYSGAVRRGSANTDGDSLMYLYHNYVASRPEKRKVMLVMSDGEPRGTSNATEERRLLNVCRFLDTKVDLIGIGVRADVSEYYPKSVAVYDADQLANETMKQVAKLLLGQRFKADASEAA